MLGIAYSASIGGIATPIGSPPNGVFLAAYKTATGVTVPFHQWMMLGGLVAILVLLAAWVVLTWRLSGVPPIETDEREDWTVAQKRHAGGAGPDGGGVDHAGDSVRRLGGGGRASAKRATRRWRSWRCWPCF